MREIVLVASKTALARQPRACALVRFALVVMVAVAVSLGTSDVTLAVYMSTLPVVKIGVAHLSCSAFVALVLLVQKTGVVQMLSGNRQEIRVYLMLLIFGFCDPSSGCEWDS